MFSPHDSPTVNEWFQRFDAASRHLPAEERAAQREEIQQHLEGLAAAKMAQGQPTEAAWKAALMQFGDPAKSKAPFFIARMADSMLPCAVITATGNGAGSVCI